MRLWMRSQAKASGLTLRLLPQTVRTWSRRESPALEIKRNRQSQLASSKRAPSPGLSVRAQAGSDLHA